MRSLIIFAFGLAMVLALVESQPMDNTERGENIQTADGFQMETEGKSNLIVYKILGRLYEGNLKKELSLLTSSCLGKCVLPLEINTFVSLKWYSFRI